MEDIAEKVQERGRKGSSGERLTEATITAAVSEGVKDLLRNSQAMIFVAGFNRPNLHYSVRLKQDVATDAYDYIGSVVNGVSRTATIYTTTVKEVETLYQNLKDDETSSNVQDNV